MPTWVLLAWQRDRVGALEQRRHAATARIATAPADNAASATPSRELADVVRAAQPARGHPDWEAGLRTRWMPSPQRQALAADVAHAVRRALDSGAMQAG